jgi:hypothetical protein
MAIEPLLKPKPRVLERDAKRKAKETQRRETYRVVEQRDQMTCRCCQKRVRKTMELRMDLLEHHHVNGRDVADAEGSWNVCLLCRGCHDERHVTRTLHISGNADGLLTFERGDERWTG